MSEGKEMNMAMVKSDQNGKASIHPETRLGYVHLTVSDLERSLGFYQDSLGFVLQRRDNGEARLGAGGDDLLALTERPGATLAARRTGLYHFAVLVPSRLELAQSLRRLIETGTSLQGGANHLVSEALYLSDPDGNGIEIYRDLPRSEWEYDHGRLKMGTEPLDYQGILAELKNEAGPWTGMQRDTRLGHMHLHVAYLPEAVEFYEDVLGFDLIMTLGSAAFLSAGGYHHHMGLNTWNGVGFPAPPADSVGLRYFTMELPDEGEVERLVGRFESAGIPFDENGEGIFVKDPSENGVMIKVRKAKH